MDGPLTVMQLRRALLANVDGHRNVIELESFARAIGLQPDVLERLRREGLRANTSWPSSQAACAACGFVIQAGEHRRANSA